MGVSRPLFLCFFLTSEWRDESMQLVRKQPSIIGLDIGTSTIKAVKMTQKGKKPFLEEFAVERVAEDVFQAGELRNPSSLAQSARSAVLRCDRHIRDVVIALPNSSILSDVITIDLVPKKHIREAVMVEAERLSPFDMTEVEIDYEVLERNEETKQMRVLMVAAKQDIIYSYIDCMNEAGLHPTIIDVDLFALMNIYQMNYDAASVPSSILINIGMESSDAVFLQNGQFHSSRDIPVTGSHFIKQLGTVAGMEPAVIHDLLNGAIEQDADVEPLVASLNNVSKDFANAVGVAVSYFQSSDGADRLDRIILAGGFANVPGLANILELRTGAEVIVLDPLRTMSMRDELASTLQGGSEGTLLSVALGLAMRT